VAHSNQKQTKSKIALSFAASEPLLKADATALNQSNPNHTHTRKNKILGKLALARRSAKADMPTPAI
jgi:hypothetical protein